MQWKNEPSKHKSVEKWKSPANRLTSDVDTGASRSSTARGDPPSLPVPAPPASLRHRVDAGVHQRCGPGAAGGRHRAAAAARAAVLLALQARQVGRGIPRRCPRPGCSFSKDRPRYRLDFGIRAACVRNLQLGDLLPCAAGDRGASQPQPAVRRRTRVAALHLRSPPTRATNRSRSAIGSSRRSRPPKSSS